MTISDEVLSFYRDFAIPANLPAEVALHNPYDDSKRRAAIESFYPKYFGDENVRVHILGINPSRMTVTATGINYTDGYALEQYCGIKNDFSKSRELTSDFFYRVVGAMGGTTAFFSRVFPWAMMPVAVTKKDSYANYYANELVEILREIVLENVKWTSQLPSNGRLVILGVGQNKKFFESLPGSPFGYNDVRVVPHPRWIMQYNRDRVDQYVDTYAEALS